MTVRQRHSARCHSLPTPGHLVIGARPSKIDRPEKLHDASTRISDLAFRLNKLNSTVQINQP